MSMQDEFLKALEKNEDDTNTRLVYADWLDEHGQHEEADRQRKWPASKEWLVEFCRVNNPPPDEDGDQEEWIIAYDVLLDLGRIAAESGEFWFSCGNNMDMCDALRGNSEDFWEHISILTGVPLPNNVADQTGFSCAC